MTDSQKYCVSGTLRSIGGERNVGYHVMKRRFDFLLKFSLIVIGRTLLNLEFYIFIFILYIDSFGNY